MNTPIAPKTPRTTHTASAKKGGTRSASGLSRQAEKSLLTQTAVLEATIACLVDLGYYNTTMEQIAKRAKVSRGAMMHHYRDRAELIEKAAKYLAEKRISEFEKLSRTLVDPVSETQDPALKTSQQGVELTKRFHALPSFTAFHELLLAARTDEQLAKIVRQCQQTINDEIPRRILKLYPFWIKKPKTMLLIHDLIQFTSRGIAMSHMSTLEPGRLSKLENLLAEVAHKMYFGTLCSEETSSQGED